MQKRTYYRKLRFITIVWQGRLPVVIQHAHKGQLIVGFGKPQQSIYTVYTHLWFEVCMHYIQPTASLMFHMIAH